MVQTLQLNESSLAKEINLLAGREGKDANAVLEEAVRHYIGLYRQRRIRSETEAWYRFPVAVRQQYAGKYVAMFDYQIVDSDTDQMKLFHRVYDKYEGQPVAIIEGGDQPMPTYRITSVKAA